ncbi:MAG: Penicillin-binding protein, 1A family, partial [Candidatus Magasanikbacteria bacterium GW2011_GWA2_37_8]
RAGFNNLIGRKAGSGGASTLTQQFIKKTMVGEDRTLWRKIKEAILALRLEKKYSKDDILKMYLNEVPFGSTNYGVESASQSYFHKPSKDLDLAEAATLAAIIQAPTRYLNNPDSLRTRRDLVLRLMFDQGLITEAQKTEAQNSAMRIYRHNSVMTAPHFVMYVQQQLVDQFGENTVDTGGLKVITTLDYDKQIAAEKIVKEKGDKLAKDFNANNAALVAIDPKTAQILALVGSRDYFNDDINGQFDVATLGSRQPGSSLKPFIYTAAFEKGYTPETVIYDTITNFEQRDGGSYQPQNYDQKEHGLVTIRTALQGSLNIPAVKTLYLVGIKNAIDFAKRFGYTTLTEDAGLSLVLGGSGVNLLEHTNAYATLANGGVFRPTASILNVANEKGDKLYEWEEPVTQEAVKPEIAALITNVLTDDKARAYIFGLNSYLTLPDRPVATKTGTTNDYKDAWTMGYVPSLAVGVWVGNTKPSPMKGGGTSLAGSIWNQFMKTVLVSTTPEAFPEPPPNTATKPVLRGADGGIKLFVNRVTGKIAASTTPEYLQAERTYLPPHDILQYVRLDDPTGPAPENPADDPQYAGWESGLQAWLEKSRLAGKELYVEEPPTEIDTPQSLELMPQVNILEPLSGSPIDNRNLNIQVQASAPRGVTQVTFLMDGNNIGTVKSLPFGLAYYAKNLSKGEHTLKAIAEDDLGNAGYAESKFILTAEMDPPDFSWMDGDVTSATKDDYPRPFQITPFRWEDAKDLKVYLTNQTGKKLIYTFLSKDDKTLGGRLSFSWQHYPGAGSYTLTGVLTDKTGKVIERSLIVAVE